MTTTISIDLSISGVPVTSAVQTLADASVYSASMPSEHAVAEFANLMKGDNPLAEGEAGTEFVSGRTAAEVPQNGIVVTDFRHDSLPVAENAAECAPAVLVDKPLVAIPLRNLAAEAADALPQKTLAMPGDDRDAQEQAGALLSSGAVLFCCPVAVAAPGMDAEATAGSADRDQASARASVGSFIANVFETADDAVVLEAKDAAMPEGKVLAYVLDALGNLSKVSLPETMLPQQISVGQTLETATYQSQLTPAGEAGVPETGGQTVQPGRRQGALLLVANAESTVTFQELEQMAATLGSVSVAPSRRHYVVLEQPAADLAPTALSNVTSEFNAAAPVDAEAASDVLSDAVSELNALIERGLYLLDITNPDNESIPVKMVENKTQAAADAVTDSMATVPQAAAAESATVPQAVSPENASVPQAVSPENASVPQAAAAENAPVPQAVSPENAPVPQAATAVSAEAVSAADETDAKAAEGVSDDVPGVVAESEDDPSQVVIPMTAGKQESGAVATTLEVSLPSTVQVLNSGMDDSAKTFTVMQAAEGIASALLVKEGELAGQGEIRILLRPDVLGGTEIRIATSGSQMTLTFVPAQAEVSAVILANQPQLLALMNERLANYTITMQLQPFENKRKATEEQLA